MRWALLSRFVRVSRTACTTSLIMVMIMVAASWSVACGGADHQKSPTAPAAMPVASIAITPGTVSLNPGQSELLTATPLDASGAALAHRTITWSSSDPATASVTSGGLVSAIKAGTISITAASEGKTGLASVTVVKLVESMDASTASRLSRNLDRLSIDWFQPAADSCNQLFLNARAYSAEQWQTFFASYFATRGFSGALGTYLGSPVLDWSPYPRDYLQPIVFSALTSVLDQDLTAAGADIEGALARSPLAASRVQGISGFLLRLASDGNSLITPTATAWAASLLTRFDTFVRTPHDTTAAAASLRRFIVIGTRGRDAVNSSTRDLLVSRLALGSVAQEVLSRFGILVYPFYAGASGPSRLSTAQEQAILDFLPLLDAGWLDLKTYSVEGTLIRPLTCCYYLENAGAPFIALWSGALTYMENPFPADAAVRPTSTWLSILVHETHHDVNHKFYVGDAWYRARRDQLIAQAGRDSMNYLRSMIGTGYFADHHEEFWSSMMQEWYVDSDAALRLALARFQSGRSAPLDQALFIIDVWARKTGQAAFFRTDGAITRTNIPVQRDVNGNVVAFTLNSSLFQFARDQGGNVTAFSEHAF